MNLDLLRIFEANPGEFISGEQLSKELGCSRTAIWKRIRQLELQGCIFEALPRKGYRLINSPKRIEAKDIMAKLHTRELGRHLHIFDQVESTQTVLLEQALQGAPHGTLAIAEEQLAGRGRMGRKWHSPFGRGIWMSLLLRPSIPLAFAPQLTLLISVAVCRAVRRNAGVEATIKWPNDIFANGKKVCGILLESRAEDERLQHVLAGIGMSVNLTSDDFSPELRDVATSLLIETGYPIDRSSMIAAVMDETEKLLDLYMDQGFTAVRSLWEALSHTVGANVAVRTAQDVVHGFAVGLNDMGALLVRQDDGRLVAVYSGDVSQ